jgi:pseudouridine-5'-monophosphatase
MKLKPISHIIFDLDGLLLDTETIYTEVTQEIVARFGKIFDWSVKSRMIGRAELDSARHLVKTLELPITPEQYLAERAIIFNKKMPHCRPMPGALNLTQFFHRHGIMQAIATSSKKILFDLKTKNHQGWLKLFDCIVLGDDPAVKKGKPAPDIFLIAALRMGSEPGHCLVFEDSPSGIQAALTAGMSVVAVPAKQMDRKYFTNANQILDSLTDFEPKQWGLPSFLDKPNSNKNIS